MGVNLDVLALNHRAVEERVRSAALRAGRTPEGITIVAVSKTFPVDVIARAIDSGIKDLGENRAQELKEKVSVLGSRARWHFVGNLQTNKVRHVVGNAVLIHSVDRYGLAEAIGRRAASLGIVQPVLLEVNVSGEATKHGCEAGRAPFIADEIAALDGVELRGVMAMAPFSDDPEGSRTYFAELRAISETIRSGHPTATEISMGMSRDFEVAVEEGSTIVRVGEAIFGARRR